MLKYFIKCFIINLLIVCCLSCAEKHKRTFNIDTALLPYVNMWINDTHAMRQMSIEFIDNASYAGQCSKWTTWSSDDMNYVTYYEIHINKQWYSGANNIQRKQVLYHELAHCVLDKGHNDSMIALDFIMCPKSIMNTHEFGPILAVNCFEKYFEYYINEILGR